MVPIVKTLENAYWQVGILPETGGSVAYGRVRHGDGWADVLRPTAEADYSDASRTASFIMLPWANRIKDGLLRFHEDEYQLEVSADDGTARHGDVRKRAWTFMPSTPDRIRLRIRSADQDNVNFPFRFSAAADYWLDGRDFVMRIAIVNEDVRAIPVGYGHHPYFVRPAEPNAPRVIIPCAAYFELDEGALATAAPVPVAEGTDYRAGLPLEDDLACLLTAREGDQPARIAYPGWGIEIGIHADDIFAHYMLYTPPEGDSFALEPQTNANDGFRLHAEGIAGTGVIELGPGQESSGLIRLRLEAAPEA